MGYSRSQALAERAVLPAMFGAIDGEASWLEETGTKAGPHRLFSHWPTETTRPALFTALRIGFADQLLRQAFVATRTLRATRRCERGLPPGANDRGLGKLLVLAPDQISARRYAGVLRGWVPAGQGATVQLATSDERNAHQILGPPFGWGPSRACWSRWPWLMRGWTRRRSPSWRLSGTSTRYIRPPPEAAMMMRTSRPHG